MSFVFTAVLLVGLTVLLITAPESALSILIDGSGKGINFGIKLFSVYVVWLSVLNLWQKLKFDELLARTVKPLLKKIFPKESDLSYTLLAVNLSTNFLGMGSAGTPAGMDAYAKMKEKRNKVMLLVVNSTSIQLIPTTIVALRSAQGATTDIILPTLLSTTVTTLVGMLLVRIFIK